MAHLFLLRLQVADVLNARRNLESNPLHNLDPISLQANDLLGIVCHQTDLSKPQIDENLRTEPIIPQIGLESQVMVGLNGISTLILKAVCPQFVDQTNASPFLTHIKDNTGANPFNQRHGGVELIPTVTSL